MKISRDAEIIALSMFSLGKCCSVRFASVRKLSARAKLAFYELEKAGMIEKIPKEKLAQNGEYGWQATNNIGEPFRDYRRPDRAESFDLFT